jgi:hypothetical protein
MRGTQTAGPALRGPVNLTQCGPLTVIIRASFAGCVMVLHGSGPSRA